MGAPIRGPERSRIAAGFVVEEVFEDHWAYAPFGFRLDPEARVIRAAKCSLGGPSLEIRAGRSGVHV